MDSRRRTLNPVAFQSSLKKLMRGTPANRLPHPQFFSIPSRTIVIAKIPYGTGPEELLSELLLRVHPIGNIEKLTMSANNTTCYVRYELPNQAKRAVRQINRRIEYDLQIYHLEPIFVYLECDAEQKTHEKNLILHNRRVLEYPRTLYIRNFGPTTTRYILQNTFSAYGELARVPDIYHKRGDLLAFVTYLDPSDMHSALLQAQGTELPDGSRLWVTPCRIEPAAVPAGAAVL